MSEPHPSYLGWQVDWPLFVKVPFGEYKAGDFFNWRGQGLELPRVAQLYRSGFLYHNTELEKQAKVGDRLEEIEGEQLTTLVGEINAIVKARTNSTTEFNRKRCKKSTIDHKQRGLIRSFLRSNQWIEEDFFTIRGKILGEE